MGLFGLSSLPGRSFLRDSRACPSTVSPYPNSLLFYLSALANNQHRCSKEISLSASRYQPYSYFINEPRYDAIARRRKLSADGSSQSCYELLVLETIRKWEGELAAKWLNDFDKLVGGLRAMLCHIGELVENDPTVMKKIKVVGILQAG